MSRYFLLLFAALLAGCGSDASKGPTGTTAAAAAKRFYDTYLVLKVNGLPNDEQSSALFPLLSPEVRDLFEEARKEQKAFIQANPDEKPPYIEGDFLSSLFEGAQKFEVGEPHMDRSFATVPVKLSNQSGDAVVEWTDHLVLVWDGSQWLVWNIEFRGNWPFKMAPTLRKALGDEANE